MPVLMQLMRHQDIKTTMRFYVGRDIQDAAEQLAAAFQEQDAEKSNKSVTNGGFEETDGEAESQKTSCFPASQQ